MILKPTLVLDKTYMPITIFSHKKAFLLSYLERCEVLEYYTNVVLTSPRKEFPAPLVIRIPVLVRHWNSASPTRRAVFIRDNLICAYCGKLVKDHNATVDHVVPKSKGGKWEWENLVTCCSSCNQKKGGKTPEEAGLKLLYKPYKPTGFQMAVSRWKTRMNDEFLKALEIYAPSTFLPSNWVLP